MSSVTPEKKPVVTQRPSGSRPRVVSPGPIGKVANNFGKRMDTAILGSLGKMARDWQWFLSRSE